jgi:hypothetical protein
VLLFRVLIRDPFSHDGWCHRSVHILYHHWYEEFIIDGITA